MKLRNLKKIQEQHRTRYGIHCNNTPQNTTRPNVISVAGQSPAAGKPTNINVNRNPSEFQRPVQRLSSSDEILKRDSEYVKSVENGLLEFGQTAYKMLIEDPLGVDPKILDSGIRASLSGVKTARTKNAGTIMTNAKLMTVLELYAVGNMIALFEEEEYRKISRFYDDHPTLRDESTEILKSNFQTALKTYERITGRSSHIFVNTLIDGMRFVGMYSKNFLEIEYLNRNYESISRRFGNQIVNQRMILKNVKCTDDIDFQAVSSGMSQDTLRSLDPETNMYGYRLKLLNEVVSANRPKAAEYVLKMKDSYIGIAKTIRMRVAEKTHEWNSRPIGDIEIFLDQFIKNVKPLMLMKTGYGNISDIADYHLKNSFGSKQSFLEGREALTSLWKELSPGIWLYASGTEAFVKSEADRIFS